MEKIKKAILTEGNIPNQLFRMTIPMVFGLMGMVIFNLADTFFVSKLGSNQLAALSFIFPVILVINSIAIGIGLGAAAVISKVVGEKNHQKVKRLGTDSILLGLCLVVPFLIIGELTIEPLFKLLGAGKNVLPYIKEYMVIWYFGLIAVTIPMIGNNIIRAMGDTKIPGLIMGVAAVVNIILDPLLIFGIGPFPELGVKGAAIATVIGRSITGLVAIYVLCFRERVITFVKVPLKNILESWKKILYIGIPNSLIKMTLPFASAIIIKLLSTYGAEAVAGYGVASKIQFFAFVFTGALASVMGPFIGQNVGAKKFERVNTGRKTGEIFSLVAGIILAGIFFIFAKPLALLFSKNPAVINTITMYIKIVPITYGAQGVLKIGTTILNVLNKPFHAIGLIIIQLFVLYLPLALLASKFYGEIGIYIALAISYLFGGGLAHLEIKKQIVLFRKHIEQENSEK